MSIWCSHPSIGHDDMAGPDEPQPRGGEVRAYAEGWSNHYPTTDGGVELPARIDLADVAPWCVPGHDQEGERYGCSGCGDIHDHPQGGEWLRLGVYAPAARSWWTKDGEKPTTSTIHADVVLDEAAARQLAADLLAWADRPKVRACRTEATP